MADKGNQNYAGNAVRHYIRRNTLNLYLTVITGVIAAIGALLSVNVFFNLSPSGLEINGCTLYTPQQIQRIGGLVPGQNLVRLNTKFIEDRLKENLVYIEEVQVVKNYPDGLRIDIIEARPRAQLEEKNGYNTISQSGRLLEVGLSERDPKLPLVVGYELEPYTDDSTDSSSMEDSEEGDEASKGKNHIDLSRLKAGTPAVSADEQKTEILTELFKEIDELKFKKIVKVDISDRTDIVLLYDNRLNIELGSSVDLDIKLRSIKAVIDKNLPESYEGTLRYNGIDSGTSAIPKQEEVPVAAPDSSLTDSADSSLQAYGDGSSVADNGYGYDENNGYSDGSEQNGGYNDYGYSEDYDYGYNDNGYGNGYDNGYQENNGDYGYGDQYGYNNGYDNGYDYGYDGGQYDYGDQWQYTP